MTRARLARRILLPLLLLLLGSCLLAPWKPTPLSLSSRKDPHLSQRCPLGGRLVVGLPGVLHLPVHLQHSLLVPAPLSARAGGWWGQVNVCSREPRWNRGGPKQHPEPHANRNRKRYDTCMTQCCFFLIPSAIHFQNISFFRISSLTEAPFVHSGLLPAPLWKRS